MNHFAVFFNHRVHAYTSSSNFSDRSVKFGNWCLTPVRCLFDGNKIGIFYETRNHTVVSKLLSSKEYLNSTFNMSNRPKKNVWRVVASIILLIPGLIIGSAFKGLGYLSPSIRAYHQLVIRHYTPVDHIIGSEENRLNLSQIEAQLREIRENNLLTQPTRNVVIYAEEGTQIEKDPYPGILDLDPKKLILIGAQLTRSPSSTSCLDMYMQSDSYWEQRHTPNRPKNATLLKECRTNTAQWKVESLAAAVRDTPPRISLFSFERYKRVYVVSET